MENRALLRYGLTGLGIAAGVSAGILFDSSHVAHADSAEGNENADQQTPDQTTPQTDDGDTVTHTVVPGETQAGIEARYDLPAGTLTDVNGLINGLPPAGNSILVPLTSQKNKSTAQVVTLGGIGILSAPPADDTATPEASIIDTAPRATPSAASSAAEVTESTVEPQFTNLPFARELPASAQVTDRVTAAPAVSPTMEQPNSPVKITTNGPSTVSIGGDGSISIDVTAPDIVTPDPTTPLPETIPTPVDDQAPATVPTAEAPIPASVPTATTPETPEAAPATPEVNNGESYRTYLDSQPKVTEPADISDLKTKTEHLPNNQKVAERSGAYNEYTDWLFSSFTPTVEGYDAFLQSGVNLTATHVFGDRTPLDEGKTIQPTCTVTHWMAGKPKDVQTFASQMKYDVQFALFPDGTLYQTVPKPNDLTYHAAGVNDRCIGNEIWGFDVLDWTPEQMETEVYRIVWLSQQYGFPLTRDVAGIETTALDKYGDFVPTKEQMDVTSVYGHKELTPIYATKDSGKIDPSSFTMNALYQKIEDLEGQLGAQPSLVTARTLASQNARQVAANEAPLATTANTAAQILQPAKSMLTLLMEAPVLTYDQARLMADARDAGFTVQHPESTTTPLVLAQPVTPAGVSPETDVNILAQLPASILKLVDPAVLNLTPRTPAEAVAASSQGPIVGGTLTAEQAYGPKIDGQSAYVLLRANGLNDVEAAVFTGIANRESGFYEEVVGDLKAASDGEVHPSYGLWQIRDVGTSSNRDPQANLIPVKAAQNVASMYSQEGSRPWEVVMPKVLTEDTLYEAIRLPARTMSPQKRAQIDARAQTIAKQIMQVHDTVEPLVQQALGVTT